MHLRFKTWNRCSNFKWSIQPMLCIWHSNANLVLFFIILLSYTKATYLFIYLFFQLLILFYLFISNYPHHSQLKPIIVSNKWNWKKNWNKTCLKVDSSFKKNCMHKKAVSLFKCNMLQLPFFPPQTKNSWSLLRESFWLVI